MDSNRSLASDNDLDGHQASPLLTNEGLDENKEVSELEKAFKQNCELLVKRFAECVLCQEPLQSHGPCACPGCGEVWCTRCTATLPSCIKCKAPFHRPLGPCMALQKLLNSVPMPCRNYRHGCTTVLETSHRLKHEMLCDKKKYSCPFVNYYKEPCSDMKLQALGRHLKEQHHIDTVYDDFKQITIKDYKAKMRERFIVCGVIAMVSNNTYFLTCVYFHDKLLILACSRPKLDLGEEDEHVMADIHFEHKDFDIDSSWTVLPSVNRMGTMRTSMKFTGSYDEPDGSLEILVKLHKRSSRQPSKRAGPRNNVFIVGTRLWPL